MTVRILAVLALGFGPWSAAGTGIHPGVDMSMKVQNLSYDLLVGNRTLLGEFVGHMEAAVVAAASSSIAKRHVWMTLSKGSGFIWVNWNIVPPTNGATVESVRAALLRPGTDQLLTEYVLNMTGLAQAAVGSLQVTYVTSPSVTVDAPMPVPAPIPAPTTNYSRYTRISSLQDCSQSDFMIPNMDFPQEVVVWMAYLGYIILVMIVISTSFYCCTYICVEKTKKRVMVFDEDPPPLPPAVPDDKTPTFEAKEPVTPVEEEDEFKDLRLDVAAAEKHLEATSVTDARGQWRSVLFTRIEDMSEIGGNGTELYFRLLRLLGLTFLFMAGLTAPTYVIGLHGDFAPDIGGELAKTTIGNVGIREDGGLLVQEARYVSVPFLGCKLLHATSVTKFFAWFDFGATLVFLTVISYFRFYVVPRTVKVSESESITCRNYTVEVDQLPPELEDMHSYESVLRDHLMQCFSAIEERKQRQNERVKKLSAKMDAFDSPQLAPQITEVVLVRNYNGRLGAIKSRAELVAQLRLAEFREDEKAVAKLGKKLEKLSQKLKEQLKPEDELPVVRAYVTLNLPSHARDLAFYYRFSVNPLFRRCQFENKRFMERAIRVQEAPQPSNIIWENQDLGYYNRMIRKLITTVVFCLLIFISMALIWVTLVSANAQSSGTSSNYLGDETCDPVYRPVTSSGGTELKCMAAEAETWTVQEAQASTTKLECWCLTQGYAKVLTDAVVRSACTPWLADVAKKVVVMGMASLIVVVINIVLQLSLYWLAGIERSNSISVKDCSVMWKIAVAQTLNTGAVPLIVNFSAPQVVQDFVKVIPGLQFVGQGDYKDFVRGWYTVVGLSLLVSMLANAFSSAGNNLFLAIWTFMYRWCCTRARCIKSYAQTELLELFTNPIFDISIRYAQLIMTVFVTMMYSSGLPLLNLFAAAYMFMMYWVDKYVLLRASKRPPFYDSQMPTKASQAMVYAVPLHCLFAIMMFGQPCTFPSNPLGGTLGYLSSSGISASGQDTTSSRLNRESTWMLVGLLAIFLAGWVIWVLLWAFALDAIWKYLRRVICGMSKKLNEDFETLPWEKAKVHIDKSYPPACYRLERSPDFRKLAMYLSGNAWFAESWRNNKGSPGTSTAAGWRPNTPGARSDAAVCSDSFPGPEDMNDPELSGDGPPPPWPERMNDPELSGDGPAKPASCALETSVTTPGAESARAMSEGVAEDRHSECFEQPHHVEEDLTLEDSSQRSIRQSEGMPADPARPEYPPPPDSVAINVDGEISQLLQELSVHEGDQQRAAPAPSEGGPGGDAALGADHELGQLRAAAAAEPPPPDAGAPAEDVP